MTNHAVAHATTTRDPFGHAESVADDLWRIVLPVPISLREVNVYVLHGPDGWSLIDCGLGTPDALAALHSGLAELGIGFGDIATLFLTHAHPDHIGPSGDIAAAMPSTGQVLMFGDGIAPMLARWQSRQQGDFSSWRQLLIQGGLDEAEASDGITGMSMMARIMRLPPAERMVPMADNQLLDLGGRTWRTVWTPGHADDHLCLVTEGMVVGGDQLLPHITPNISRFPGQRPNPMQDYLESLDRLEALQLENPLVLPGHSRPFQRMAERMAELRESIHRRANRVVEILQEADHPLTALEIAGSIWGQRLRTGDDRRLALGETLAHLERLRQQSIITEALDGPVAHFSLSAPLIAPNLDNLAS